jgi:hypothetical protein
VSVAPANDYRVARIQHARVVVKFYDGRSFSGEAEELGRNLSLFLLAVFCTEGLPEARSFRLAQLYFSFFLG